MLERSDELGALAAAARSAVRGAGSVALVHGEAGIGKSTVVRALRTALPPQARLLVGYCDALSTPRTLGPFKDVAATLGDEVSAAVAAGQRDAVMAALLAALGRGVPTVLVVEDVHWADEATLDVLRFLARRIDDLPVVLVLTYRDELDRDHPLSALLGDLGHRSGVTRLALPRLSPAGVAELTASARLDPRTVYELSDGNPYLVTEMIASAGEAGTTPATVVDGVLGRLRLLAPGAQRVVEQLAVVPGALGRDLIDRLAPDAWSHLDEAEARGLLVVANGVVSFRHELTRRAVADTLSGSLRSALNLAALRVLEDGPDADVSRVMHHAIESGDDDAVVRNGPAAAREAIASGAHREAARHLSVVLDHEDSFSASERAELWLTYAVELYTVGDGRCVEPCERAVAIRRTLDDLPALARSLRWLSRVRWFAGLPEGARAVAAEAIDVARHSDDEAVLALTLSNDAQLAMLFDEHDDAIVLARRAVEIARRIGDLAILSHALTNLGTSLFRSTGRIPEAEEALREAIEIAVGIDDHEDACRAYVNLSWSLLDVGDVAGADRYARAGVEHAQRSEFLTFWQYLLALSARVALARGEWDEALALIAEVRPDVLSAWLVALSVRLAVAVRRGGQNVDGLLTESWTLADRLAELQRIVPILCVTLEAEQLAGAAVPVDAVAVLARARERVRGLQVEELSFRLRADGAPTAAGAEIAGRSVSPFGLMAQGRWREAADEWEHLGWPYHQAEALAASPDVDDQLVALEILDRLGAVPLATAVRRRLRSLGDVRVPRGPAVDTRTDPAGLTARQQAVLALLAEGHTNAEIADRLVVSVRTVDSHVAAILAKLGVATRREAAALARQRQAAPADIGTARASSR